MSSLVCPDRVVACVGRIARNASRPGVECALDRCLEGVDALRREERITAEQREAMRLILLGIGMHAA
ncbi:hypothetical protein [Paludisphaera mucosa]|uniref:Uncharacterized protein n=1 Tax=Paludisphaera mucosa TaxID=3030827 RepID=A0ABT6FDD7_9BACT|nr:hypothetical protein [Paludisphaera mucosa]MDG3005598.1 hypothetical protein [Paludisphaera mucosa]